MTTLCSWFSKTKIAAQKKCWDIMLSLLPSLLSSIKIWRWDTNEMCLQGPNLSSTQVSEFNHDYATWMLQPVMNAVGGFDSFCWKLYGSWWISSVEFLSSGWSWKSVWTGCRIQAVLQASLLRSENGNHSDMHVALQACALRHRASPLVSSYYPMGLYATDPWVQVPSSPN
jgi:hypothetical protein